MTTIFHITKKEGHNYTGQSREIMAEQFGGLPEGRYKVVIEKVGAYENPSRYKYFFAIVMAAILEKCGNMFRVISHRTGEEVPWRTTADVHAYMKLRYNPHTLTTPTGIFIVPGSTTEISDRDFINEYMEVIMSDFASSPYFVEFKDIDDWRAEMKAKKERNSSH